MSIERFEVRGYDLVHGWLPADQIADVEAIREWTVYENREHPDQGTLSDWQAMVDTNHADDAIRTCKRLNELAAALAQAHLLSQVFQIWTASELSGIAERTDSTKEQVIQRLVTAHAHTHFKVHPLLEAES